MSTLAEQPYVPTDHAPDPVTSHGDPSPPGKIGIWLFLASEIMFFMGILGSYIVLRAGSPQVFAEHAESLNRWAAALNTVVLIFSSLTMALAVDGAAKGNRSRTVVCLLVTILCAGTFMVVKFFEYKSKIDHVTVPAIQPAATPKAWVFDGHYEHGNPNVIIGYRAEMPKKGFNIHRVSEKWVRENSGQQHPERFDLAGMNVLKDEAKNFGPSRNIFFSCYYALTAVHGLHVVGGIVALVILLAQSLRGKLLPAATEYTGLYWHFVDLVWIFLFPLLYLI